MLEVAAGGISPRESGDAAEVELERRLQDIRSQLRSLDQERGGGGQMALAARRAALLELVEMLEQSLTRPPVPGHDQPPPSPPVGYLAAAPAGAVVVDGARSEPRRRLPLPGLPRLRNPVRAEPQGAMAGASLGLTLPRRREALAKLAAVLTLIALLGTLFLGWEFLLSGLVQGQAQRALLLQFKQAIATQSLDSPTALVPEGAAVAVLKIPRLGLSQVVVEGSSPTDLKSGPGHVRASPLPGEFGNSLIAGRRTTYGAPFANLNRLKTGDLIVVTTGQGTFKYRVIQIRRVAVGQIDPLGSTLDSRLTLLTSNPAYAATGRLVVVAKLQGLPVALANRPPVPVGTQDLGMAGDPAGFGLALLWALLLAGVFWATGRLRRIWPGSVRFMLATPVLVGLTVLMFAGLDQGLPGTL